MKRAKLLAGTAVALMGCSLAQAQEAGTTNDGELALGVVTVTSEKREQDLQDVPASVSAFGAQDIEDAGWADIDRVQNALPSVVVGGEGQTRTFVYIRGIGTSKFDIGSDGSVGVFIDEVFSARTSNNLTGILDLERIEVLKGPQGTLYGRNTIGGAIAMYTAQPENDWSGKVRLAAGNDNYYLLGGTMSGALVEGKLLMRFSGSSSDVDGVYTETNSGNTNNNRNNAARLSLIALPNDLWTVTLTGDVSDLSSHGVLTEPYLGIVGFGSPALDLSGAVADNLSDRYSNPMTTPGYFDLRSDQVSLKIERQGDQFDFTSISSRTSEEYSELRDFDGSEPDAIFNYVDQDSTQYSQELRLSSVPGGFLSLDDRLQWLLGAYYFTDDAQRADEFIFGPDGLLAPPPPLFPGLSGNSSRVIVDLETTSLAVYGQATFALTPKLNLTLGLRHTEDEKDFSYTGITNTPGFPVLPVDFVVSDSLSFSSTDPKITLDYAVTEDVMVYGTYAEGFKSGGVQFAVYDAASANSSFDEENLRMIEVGLKSRFFDDRVQLNSAVYQYDYENQQVQSIVSIGGAPQALTQNAGDSTLTGFETELVALLAEGLTVTANYTYQDATFDRFESLTGSLSGNRLPRTPEHAFVLGAQYTADLGGNGELTLKGNYGWKDDYYFNFENTVGTDSYGVLDLTAWWDLPNGSTRLRVFCDNCSNEEYLHQIVVFPPTLGGGGRESWANPRRYGIELTQSF